MAEKLVNDTLKPKIVKLNLGFLQSKDRTISLVKIINDLIFIKIKNNLILHLKKNDWMETKSFSDP